MTTHRLAFSSLLSVSALSLALVLASGCSGDDAPLGDDDETSGDGDGDPTGDGDGDPSGDGDGDPTGDGDGDPSGDGDGDPSGDGDGDPTEGEDMTPPTVTMTSPSADEAGVLANAIIEVSFSEPMNKASVQAAWQSAALPGNAVTFAWDTEGTMLTVTPNAPLVIAEIDSIDDPAEVYSFSINSAATDLAGNGLDPEFASSFTTARRSTVTLLPYTDLTNYVGSAGSLGPFGDRFRVGDTAGNVAYRAFVSYDLTGLPEDTIALAGADIRLLDWAVVGSPFAVNGGLGSVQLHDIEFDTIISTTYNTAPGDLITNLLGLINPVDIVHDVSSYVVDDFEAAATYTQFRLSTAMGTNSNGAADYVTIIEVELPLEVAVLIP